MSTFGLKEVGIISNKTVTTQVQSSKLHACPPDGRRGSQLKAIYCRRFRFRDECGVQPALAISQVVLHGSPERTLCRSG